MINLDLDPMDEFAQGWPEGTVFLLLARHADEFPSINEYILDASSRDYVDWAVNALLEGFEAPGLSILAGLDFGKAASKWDVVPYFDRCMRELNIEVPKNGVTLLRGYLYELVKQIASGEADAHETLDRIHRRIVNPLNHSQDVAPWCYLWDGSWRNTEKDIVAYAKSWIKNGADNYLSWLSEGLEVTHTPNPVRARRGGPNGQRYEWVFETKVRAIDRPVGILDIGFFSRQGGRWVFSTPTGRPFNAKDFADRYSCPGAVLRPGESFSTLNSVSSCDLRDWTASWYFRGVTPPHGGVVVKGTAIVEGLPVLEARCDSPGPSQSLDGQGGTWTLPASSPPEIAGPEARRAVPDTGADPGYEVEEEVREDEVAAPVRADDSGSVELLVAAIEESDADVRRAGIAALVQMGEPAVEPLLGALKDSRPGVRRSATVALGQIGDSRAVEPLLMALKDSNENVRRAAAAALGQIGDARALEPLLAALKGSDGNMCKVAAKALWRIGDARPGEPLLTVLKESDRAVRWKAVSALAEDADARAVEGFWAALQDSSESIRSIAATALGRLKDARSVEPLVAALEDGCWSVRQAVVRALGWIGHPRAVAPLVSALNDSQRDVRRVAAEALGRIGDSRAVAPLVAVLKDNRGPRPAAASALGDIGDPRAVEPLQALLADRESIIRSRAAESLGKIGDKRALVPLMALYRDNTPAVRGAAIRALGHLGDDCVMDLLLTALRDKSWFVRDAAVAALVQVGKPAVAPLVTVLNDSEPDVRCRVAKALGWIGDGRAAASLILALKDGSDEVRKSAASALAKIGQPAVAQLQAALEDSNKHVRETAAALLEELGVSEGDSPAPPESSLAGSAPLAPHDALVWKDEAQRLADLGQWPEAINCYEKALALAPRDASAWFDKGRCLAALGLLDEAIDCYGQAVAIDAQLGAAWFSKALAEEKLGRTQDAIQAFKQYIAVGVDQDAKQIEYARECLRNLGCDWSEHPASPGPAQSAPSPQSQAEDSVADHGVTQKDGPSTGAPEVSLDQAPDRDEQHEAENHDAARPSERSRRDREERTGSFQSFRPALRARKPGRPRRASGAASGGYRKGDRIGEFEVQGVLGRGGFGVVYLVHLPTIVEIASLGTFRDEDLPSRGRPSDRYVTYALKTLHDPYLAVPEVRQRFRHEAQMLVDLERHPHVLQADFVDEIEGRLYIATEYVAPNSMGLNSVEGYLQRQPPDLAQSLRWAIQLCYGMEYLRSKGLRCHRDLKPANILITLDGRVKIADFGLAGVLEVVRLAEGIQVHIEDGRIGLSAQTAEGAGFGTPTHMPPEQFTNAASCDERSDVYAFGVVLYQMVSRGRLPFLAAPPRDGSVGERRRFWAEMYRLHSTAPVRRLDSPLFPVIERCLAKEPDQRFQGFSELREALKPLLRRETGEVVQAPIAAQLTAGEWHIKGYSLASMGLWEKAVECYDRSLALEPQHAQTWTNKGHCVEALGRREEAIECHDRALALNPSFADAWNNKGVTLNGLGQREEAIACFERALSLDPAYAEAWSNKATSLLDLGRQREAISCMDRALELAPQNAMMWKNKGQLLTGMGYWEEALTCFDRALTLNPRLADGWSCKAETLSYLGNREEAIACCDRALALDPRHTVALTNKGANLSVLGRREEAIACYERVLALNPQEAMAWNNKANNLVALGRANEAMACYERAVALDPEYAHAWFNKAATEERLGRWREAARSYKRFLAVASPQDVMHIEHARNRLFQLGDQ